MRGKEGMNRTRHRGHGEKRGRREMNELTGYPLALLINFNVPLLKDGIRRIILS
jgi:hypothetical protein